MKLSDTFIPTYVLQGHLPLCH